MDNIRKFSKGLLGFLVLLGFVWLVLVGVFENGGTRLIKNSKLMKTHKRSSVHPKIEFNFVSKRRVPNGPDPIHNRRARSSRRPPGQASKGKLNIKP
ncbi:CLAVATA3/ESR (CLE)-related protein 25 [Lycium ferocissimum]|uniref:CLAVATA3/ESR (CLE)-related protein 25 n=1 Tax=Lycium ferocissimum TaxID=112874 RepID=UPI0028150A50|nr:CLAVATA3/ESR (CLE)-related protein 25 [Lycium ferocissimum]